MAKKKVTAKQAAGLAKGQSLMKKAVQIQKEAGYKTVKVAKMKMSDALKKAAKR